tara:strand:+ start:2742 stop:3449 length:708 start_codon:yes stop_codon:yes gene_type:complete
MKYYFFFFLIIANSCSYPKLSSDELVYENDFENENISEIDGGSIISYNNTKVLGNYNNDGFTLHLNNLNDHDYVYVSFDLYIHGSWDGNFNGFTQENHGIDDKPDLWGMELRPDMDNYKDIDFQKFETTFSNSVCYPNYCLRQSFPNNYPFENNPKTGSDKINLIENCITPGWNNTKTSLYKIEKGFNHEGNALVIRFYDKLFQPNAIDPNGESIEKCDESWSLDNLKIRVISYD